MHPAIRRVLMFAILLGLVGGTWILLKKPAPAPAPVVVEEIPEVLSVLGEKPDWSKLERFQNTFSREEFENLLTTVFTTGNAWRNLIEIDESEARIHTSTDPEPAVFHLKFSTPSASQPTPRDWKSAADLPPAPASQPLANLHIAIDPGHIGGAWAKIEERWLKHGETAPVCEGDMTLFVANLLKPRLEALGAKVSLVRSKNEPITSLRPDSLLDIARESMALTNPTGDAQKTAERLFYRTAEIRARAKLVNHSLKPDLILCLHFNADPWGNPSEPTLVTRSHLHLLLNGAYTDEEILMEDQRFAMLEKILSRTHDEEARIGTTVADVFSRISGLPPFIYPPDSTSVRPINDHPYLWARNLLANRLYECPVIFMEPYVMNSSIDHPRIVAGDYDGVREINGKLQPSIFREYADALSHGLADYYGKHRRTAP